MTHYFLRKNAREIWNNSRAMLLMYAKNMPGLLYPGPKRQGIEAKQKTWQPLLRQLAQTMELSYLSQECRFVRVRTGLDSRGHAA
jgi:hypothetical protein